MNVLEEKAIVPTHCVGPQNKEAGKASSCEGCPNQGVCASGAFRGADPSLKLMNQQLKEIQHTILVLSGKGGVGKSTVTKELGLSLGRQGHSVGLLDIDICGPSLARMTGCQSEEIHNSRLGWEPIAINDNVVVMSTQLLLQHQNEAIVWRGPRKNKLIQDFLTQVFWGPLDLLLIDTPPGTTDEHISIVNYLKSSVGISGAVVVTTPQKLSLVDVRRELSFCVTADIPILGLIENMRGFVCPHCKSRSEVFPAASMRRASSDANQMNVAEEAQSSSAELKGFEILAEEFNIPKLGSIPLDMDIMERCETGSETIADQECASPSESNANPSSGTSHFDPIASLLYHRLKELRKDGGTPH